LHQARHNLLLKAVGVEVGVAFSGTLRRIACLWEDKDMPHCDLELVIADMSGMLYAVWGGSGKHRSIMQLQHAKLLHLVDGWG